ncbi:MAG: type II toxin-antitoxin system VapC family toxin [Candidatus Aminicenantales bacterium]
MRVFFDSSGLAKRYIRERGSDEVEEILSVAGEVGLSVIAPAEVVSALNRLRRQRSIAPGQYDLVKSALFSDLEDVSVVGVTNSVVAGAINLLEDHPIRTLDAIHVASAVEWDAELFVSSDERQLAAAAERGLRARRV